MSNKHILDTLESKGFAGLSESELAEIRAHVSECSDCKQAYKVARISLALLKERAAQNFEPSLFFHTRVLAALREQQAGSEAWALGRLWRAAGALVSTMAVTVATLAVLSFVAPASPNAENVASAGGDAAEIMILSSGQLPEDQVSDSQVLTTLYAEEDGVK